MSKTLSRRSFIKTSSTMMPLILTSSPWASTHSLPCVRLGQTSLYLSKIGLGTGMLHRAPDNNEALKMIEVAYNHGINYFDTAYNYGAGQSEMLLGKALNKHRDNIVISSKTMNRTYNGAMQELETTLKRLQTEYLDLWILHNAQADDFETCFSSHGVYRAMCDALRQGKCRYTGISASSNPFILRKYIDTHSFNIVMMPLNAVDFHYLTFEKHALPHALNQKRGCIAFKPFAMGKLLQSKKITLQEALRYTVSLPVHSTLIGCTNRRELHSILNCLHLFKPLGKTEKENLLARTYSLSGRQTEWYKEQVHRCYNV